METKSYANVIGSNFLFSTATANPAERYGTVERCRRLPSRCSVQSRTQRTVNVYLAGTWQD
jgi:hypothetical protein